MEQNQFNTILEEIREISNTLTASHGGSTFAVPSPINWNHHFDISNEEYQSSELSIKVDSLEDCFELASRFFNNGKTSKDVEKESKGLDKVNMSKPLFLHYFRTPKKS